MHFSDQLLGDGEEALKIRVFRRLAVVELLFDIYRAKYPRHSSFGQTIVGKEGAVE